MALVSVITRTKDRCLLLERAINTVLDQSFSDWEHIIVDDGSQNPQEIDELVAKHKDRYEGRLKLLHNPESLGMEAASNVGINNSSAKYIAILDDDDSWHELFLRKCVDFLANKPHKNINGVITHSVRVLEDIKDGKVAELKRLSFNAWLRTVSLWAVAGANQFCANAFVFERSCLEKVGLYREDLPVLGDWEFNLRFLRDYDVGVIPEELSYFHTRPPNTDGSFSNTVVDGTDRHALYDTMIRNEYLRKDLSEGKPGLGWLLSQSKSERHIVDLVAGRTRAVNFVNRIYDRFFGPKDG
jgi:glycosyltransferase involved in cell wall biosynthesis